MPVYEFSCPACNLIVEQEFSVYVDHIVNCGQCGIRMEKKFSPNPVHFKGTGFYKTGG